MSLALYIATLWFVIGFDVLMFLIWGVVSHRLPLRITWLKCFQAVVFWPDIIAAFIGHVRHARQKGES